MPRKIPPRKTPKTIHVATVDLMLQEIPVHQIKRDFAIHKVWKHGDPTSGKFLWRVTHIPSGKSVVSTVRLQSAREFIEAVYLIKEVDWSSKNPTSKEHPALPAVLDLVQRVTKSPSRSYYHTVIKH